jgi:hypothetical protein
MNIGTVVLTSFIVATTTITTYAQGTIQFLNSWLSFQSLPLGA